MSKKTILRPDALTINEILSERNVEVRRIMIERYGPEKLLKQTGKVLDRSKSGTLYALELDREESIVMLEVTCPSTERKFWLRVPPNMRKAREAVAWSFGLSASAYRPVAET